MLYSEVIYDIKKGSYGSLSSYDISVSNEQIGYWIDAARAILIRRTLQENHSSTQNFVQDILGVELEKAEDLKDKSYHRTKLEIPKTISYLQFDGYHLLTSVYTSSGLFIPVVSEIQFFTAHYRRYNKSAECAFLRSNRLYVSESLNYLSTVNMSGIFERPKIAHYFGEGYEDKSDDFEYPLDMRYIPDLMQIINAEKFKYAKVNEG